MILFLLALLPLWAQAFTVPKSELKLTYILENHYNTGGAQEGNILNGLAFLEFSAPEIEFFPIGDTQLYFSLMGYHGESPSHHVGDLQWTSSIDTNGNEGIKIFEAFINQDLFTENLRFRVGLMDLSLTYNINEPALLFMHSTPGTTAEWGASGRHGAPVYPFPSFGADLQFDSVDGHYVYAAVTTSYAGNKEDARLTQSEIIINGNDNFHLIEAGRDFKNAKIGLGYWGYANKSDRLDGKLNSNGQIIKARENGWYAMADALIGDRFHPFLRYGQMTNELVQPMKASLTLGFTMSRPFGLERDTWGLMMSSAYLSKDFVDESDKRQNTETAYEAVYRHHFNPNFDGMLAYMYVDGPSGGATRSEPLKRISDANILVMRIIFKI